MNRSLASIVLEAAPNYPARFCSRLSTQSTVAAPLREKKNIGCINQTAGACNRSANGSQRYRLAVLSGRLTSVSNLSGSLSRRWVPLPKSSGLLWRENVQTSRTTINNLREAQALTRLFFLALFFTFPDLIVKEGDDEDADGSPPQSTSPSRPTNPPPLPAPLVPPSPFSSVVYFVPPKHFSGGEKNLCVFLVLRRRSAAATPREAAPQQGL